MTGTGLDHGNTEKEKTFPALEVLSVPASCLGRCDKPRRGAGVIQGGVSPGKNHQRELIREDVCEMSF